MGWANQLNIQGPALLSNFKVSKYTNSLDAHLQ
jgi:hypothetical protein